MSRLEFVIDFPPGLIHRVRNFAEDLFLRLSRANIGTVSDIDNAMQQVRVRATAPSHLGEVSEQIDKALARHLFAGQAIVRRVK